MDETDAGLLACTTDAEGTNVLLVETSSSFSLDFVAVAELQPVKTGLNRHMIIPEF
jgi:hypothetical protein